MVLTGRCHSLTYHAYVPAPVHALLGPGDIPTRQEGLCQLGECVACITGNTTPWPSPTSPLRASVSTDLHSSVQGLGPKLRWCIQECTEVSKDCSHGKPASPEIRAWFRM